MEDTNVIRIAIMGGTSCGKSTFMNALFTKQYSDMKIKRTTMLPQVYIETDDPSKCEDMKEIYLKNQEENRKILEGEIKLTKENCKQIPHLVPKIEGFIDIPDDIHLEVYDIPGLDDGETKPIYFEWINDNFHKFDLVFFIVDIQRALNTSDERDILNLIADNIAKHKKLDIKLVTLVNKCDDMFYDDKDNDNSYFSFGKKTVKKEDTNRVLLMDEEYTEMFDQIKDVLKKTAQEKQVKIAKYKFPISAEDAFIYRMYNNDHEADLDIKFSNKFGINEHGRSKWNRMLATKKQEFIKNYFNENEGVFTERLNFTGLNQVIKVVDEQILNKKRQQEILVSRFKNDIENNTFINLTFSLDETNNKFIINKYKNFIVRIQDIDRIYETDNIVLVADSLKIHINKFIDFIQISNNNKDDLERLEKYKIIIDNIKDELELDVLKIKIMFDTNDKWNQVFNTNKPNIKWSFTDLIGKLSKSFSNLQNDYFKGQIYNINSVVYENFPNNLKDKLIEVKENGYKDMEELITKAFENIVNYSKSSTSGPMVCYEILGSKVFDNFITDIMYEINYDYPLDKLIKFYEKYLCNIYYYLELRVGNDPNGVPYSCYPILLDDYLVNEYFQPSEKGQEFYYNLKIINKAFMNSTMIDYKKIIEYNNFFSKVDEICSSIRFYEKLINEEL
jgi:GTPase Era involved in 16S rRNA processing